MKQKVKRPKRLIHNSGVGNGQAPSYLRYVALGVLAIIAVVIVGGIVTVAAALL